MSYSFRHLDPRTRRLIAVGSLCLALGLILLNLLHPASQIERNWLHGIGGFFVGFSIAVNLSALLIVRRCNWARNPDENSPVLH
jgi:hypothetical protein